MRSGDPSVSQLVADIRAGDWDGSPDNYDANAITAKLGSAGFSVSGSPAAPASTTSFLSRAGKIASLSDPLNWPGEIAGSAVSSVAGDVGVYILKGVLTLIGGGLIVYGATLLTDRRVPSGGESAGAGGAAEDAGELAAVAA